jgi:hypothetical protein
MKKSRYIIKKKGYNIYTSDLDLVEEEKKEGHKVVEIKRR